MKFASTVCLVCALCCGAHGAASSREVFKQVKESLVILQGSSVTGSGFVLKMEEGRAYLLTNRHNVEGQKRVAAFLLSGKQLALGKFQYAKDLDLVRFELLDSFTPSLAERTEKPNAGDEVFVFGGGEGGESDFTGAVKGMEAERLEVTAPFAAVNSGTAVLDEKGRVLGVATYPVHDPEPKDWSRRDSQDKVRRYALRIAGAAWRTQKYEIFHRKSVARINQAREDAGILPEGWASFSSPKMSYMPLPGRNEFRIMSDITLSIRSKKKTIKTPVVRLVLLVRGANGKHYVRDCSFSDIGSMKHVCTCLPIHAYGNSKGGGSYRVGNDLTVYCLEGVSYYQSQFPDKTLSRCGIRYFNKAQDSEEQLFRVSEKVCGGKPPEIVCFRLECWQNGSLAGEYNSAPPNKLNAMELPVDWFVMHKYGRRFDYGPRGGSLVFE